MNAIIQNALKSSIPETKPYHVSTSKPECYHDFEREIRDNITAFKKIFSGVPKPIGTSGIFFLVGTAVVAVVTSEPDTKLVKHLAAHCHAAKATKAVIFNPVVGNHRVINVKPIVDRLVKYQTHVFVYDNIVAVIKINFFERKTIFLNETTDKTVYQAVSSIADRIINLDNEWIKDPPGKKTELYCMMHDGIENTSDIIGVVDHFYKMTPV